MSRPDAVSTLANLVAIMTATAPVVAWMWRRYRAAGTKRVRRFERPVLTMSNKKTALA